VPNRPIKDDFIHGQDRRERLGENLAVNGLLVGVSTAVATIGCSGAATSVSGAIKTFGQEALFKCGICKQEPAD
jgi:hypothetical protein